MQRHGSDAKDEHEQTHKRTRAQHGAFAQRCLHICSSPETLVLHMHYPQFPEGNPHSHRPFSTHGEQ